MPMRLTYKRLKAIGSALGSVTAGGPEDAGLDENSPEGLETFELWHEAHYWVTEELARRDRARKKRRSKG